MAVPAHDERDYGFWSTYKSILPEIKTSVVRNNESYFEENTIAPLRPGVTCFISSDFDKVYKDIKDNYKGKIVAHINKANENLVLL